MVKVEITYNPYLVNTEICIDGRKVEDRNSKLAYVKNKRLQEWSEPKDKWNGIFPELRESTGESEIQIEFVGTFGDFDDLLYAKDKFGQCFTHIDLIHKNKETAGEVDPYQKVAKLKELYKKLQEGPIEELKTEDIQKNFDTAFNSEFRIVIVAPMSSGKSTLINSMLGRDLLPAVNQATTAVITEIKDNDDFPDFLVNATDKYGKVVVKNERATKELISELNYKKDPKDRESKNALIPLVQIEGPIPNLSSKTLNTVFVDTPGGNNSQNDEHEKMMDDAINDENKSLILYVFNGAQLGTNDSNVILKKIANAMKNSTNGKQSRDRFLFVANRMDEFDISEEPYEEVIQKTILPQLASNGITEPTLFLASAQTAKLIRMVQSGEELSESEEEDLDRFVKRFNRQSRVLPKYASLNTADKEKLISEEEECVKKSKEEDISRKEEVRLKFRAAEINSGIPAVELAIKQYLEKYAISIKIKTAHDSFMKKVNERKMMDNCKAEWAESKASFDSMKRNIREKREKYDYAQKLPIYKSKIEKIKLNTKGIKGEQVRVTKEINQLVKNQKEKIGIDEAEYILGRFQEQLQAIGEEAQINLENEFNNSIRNSCQEMVEEYTDYIKKLDTEGYFNIGSLDLKQMADFDMFDMNRAEDFMADEKYVSTERVKTGTERVKKRGFFSGLARFFGVGGYETVDVYEEQQFVMIKQLIRDQVTEIQHEFDTEMNMTIKNTEEKVQAYKDKAISKVEQLDEKVQGWLGEIDQMLENQEKLQKEVRENETKAKWLEDFVKEVDGLLAV